MGWRLWLFKQLIFIAALVAFVAALYLMVTDIYTAISYLAEKGVA